MESLQPGRGNASAQASGGTVASNQEWLPSVDPLMKLIADFSPFNRVDEAPTRAPGTDTAGDDEDLVIIQKDGTSNEPSSRMRNPSMKSSSYSSGGEDVSLPRALTNLARGAPAFAMPGAIEANHMTDSSLRTVWKCPCSTIERGSKAHICSCWVFVDLLKEIEVDHLLINWGESYPKQGFHVQVSMASSVVLTKPSLSSSDINSTWETLLTVSNCDGGTSEIPLPRTHVRCIRLLPTQPSAHLSLAVRSFEMYCQSPSLHAFLSHLDSCNEMKLGLCDDRGRKIQSVQVVWDNNLGKYLSIFTCGRGMDTEVCVGESLNLLAWHTIVTIAKGGVSSPYMKHLESGGYVVVYATTLSMSIETPCQSSLRMEFFPSTLHLIKGESVSQFSIPNSMSEVECKPHITYADQTMVCLWYSFKEGRHLKVGRGTAVNYRSGDPAWHQHDCRRFCCNDVDGGVSDGYNSALIGSGVSDIGERDDVDIWEGVGGRIRIQEGFVGPMEIPQACRVWVGRQYHGVTVSSTDGSEDNDGWLFHVLEPTLSSHPYVAFGKPRVSLLPNSPSISGSRSVVVSYEVVGDGTPQTFLGYWLLHPQESVP